MAAVAGRMVANQVPGGRQEQQDPYYEKVESRRMGMKFTKKQKRAPPPGLNPKEQEVLKKVRKRAYSLDMALFNLCGLRFGWSSVIGLVPVIGDMLDALLACLLIRKCCSVDPKLPGSVVFSMYSNIVLDFLVGLIPVLGDLADAAYKCNTKNYVLLEKEMKRRSDERQKELGKRPDPNAGVGLMDLEDEANGSDSDLGGAEEAPPSYASGQPTRPEQAYRPGRAATGARTRGDVDLEAGR